MLVFFVMPRHSSTSNLLKGLRNWEHFCDILHMWRYLQCSCNRASLLSYQDYVLWCLFVVRGCETPECAGETEVRWGGSNLFAINNSAEPCANLKYRKTIFFGVMFINYNGKYETVTELEVTANFVLEAAEVHINLALWQGIGILQSFFIYFILGISLIKCIKGVEDWSGCGHICHKSDDSTNVENGFSNRILKLWNVHASNSSVEF